MVSPGAGDYSGNGFLAAAIACTLLSTLSFRGKIFEDISQW